MSKGTCMLCFAVNVRIFDISDTHLQSVYEQITDFKIQDDLHCLCYICLARFQQCYHLVQQIHNNQKSPQDDINEIGHKSLVRLSSHQIENTSIPYHCVTIKQETDVKEEIADDFNEDNVENPKDFKCETKESTISSCNELKQDEKTLAGEKSLHTMNIEKNSIPYHFVTIKQEPDVKEIADDFKDSNKGVSSEIVKVDVTDFRDPTYCMKTFVGDKPYNCDVCNKTFALKKSANRHKKIHNSDKLTCDVCNKTFSEKRNLKIHQRIHTGEKPYACDVCNMTFTQKGSLKTHEKTHTDERPYSCDICNETFVHNYQFNIHKMIHNGQTPYKCDVCNKTFYYRRTLNCHKRMHTGKKPYSCDICNKVFNYKKSLDVHKRRHCRENGVIQQAFTSVQHEANKREPIRSRDGTVTW